MIQQRYVMFRLDWDYPNVLNRTLVFLAIDAAWESNSYRKQPKSLRKLFKAGAYPKPRHVKCALNVLRHHRPY